MVSIFTKLLTSNLIFYLSFELMIDVLRLLLSNMFRIFTGSFSFSF